MLNLTIMSQRRKFDISGRIDKLIPVQSQDQHVSTGQAVVAMILNGLGFVNQRLYLVSQFFEDKPVDRLIKEGLQASHLNDDRLGRALDSLYESGSLATDLVACQKELFQQSLFVLASDQIATTQEEQAQMLLAYKAQHSVERGFRFMKDPQIVASSFFVNKPQRLEALLFIMTLCLLIYSLLEYKIRQGLAKQNKKVPDQKGKATANPTARWIFHCFVGIHLLRLPDGKEAVLNLKEVHKVTLSLFPDSYLDLYS
jgi:transposase